MQVQATRKPQVRTEQMILFRCSNQMFAISSGSVQEVRSVDSLAGVAEELNDTSLKKVRHVLRRGGQNVYLVNVALHFGLKPSPVALIFLLRKSRIALLIDGIEKMTTISQLQAVPSAFCHQERQWYRGLTVLDQNVLPVVNPDGFLTKEELATLDETARTLSVAAEARTA